MNLLIMNLLKNIVVGMIIIGFLQDRHIDSIADDG